MAFWQARALDEYRKARMTLFGTLTIAPEWDARIDAQARIALFGKGVDFDRLGPVEMFRARCKYGGVEITKYLKRLREGSPDHGRRQQIRYLLIAEAHDSAKTSDAKRGRPHWHILLHEQWNNEGSLVLPAEWERDSAGELRRDKYGNPFVSNASFLKRNWSIGHSSYALCQTPQTALYLCKYLTKDAAARVRCSYRYGTQTDPGRTGASESEAES